MSEREAFESAYRARYPVSCELDPEKFNLSAEGDYEDIRVSIAWFMWQCGRALAAPTAPTTASSPSDAERLDWIAIHGSFGLDSVTGLPGGDGQKRVAATRTAIDAAIATEGGKL